MNETVDWEYIDKLYNENFEIEKLARFNGFLDVIVNNSLLQTSTISEVEKSK